MPPVTQRAAILKAIEEYDRLGQARFLEKYGFGRARSYFLIYNGKRYDSKAIVGAAHGYEHPQLGPLRSEDFCGGWATVKHWLEDLGFELQVLADIPTDTESPMARPATSQRERTAVQLPQIGSEPLPRSMSTLNVSHQGSLCRWLHEQLEVLPVFKFPFTLAQLPMNGVYFFYEEGENWGHGLEKPRIVRIGSHRDGNFRSRMDDHFLLSESRIAVRTDRAGAKDRSIFRKNLGRALLARNGDSYRDVWEIDFTTRANREEHGHLRDLEREAEIESSVTKRLRETFSFTFVLVESQETRLGIGGLEGALIGTVARCGSCKPSSNWLGSCSPVEKIRTSGLWLVQHLNHPPMTEQQRGTFLECVARTAEWAGRR